MFFSRRFFPLFVSQFFGAFNDNFLKFAIITLINFKMNDIYTEKTASELTYLASAIFILPYFLFSGTAGQIMDKFDRARMVYYLKITELVLMVMATWALAMHEVWALLVLLFFMGVQSTFFSPAKYALLPQQLQSNELVPGNAYIAAATYMAILLGSLLGNQLPITQNGEWWSGGLLVVLALVGMAASWFILPAPGPMPKLKIKKNCFTETWVILRMLKKHRSIYLCILGLSSFWLFGVLALAQLPAFCKQVLGGTETLVSVFMGCFTIGVALGALICSKLAHGRIIVKPVPYAAAGIMLAGFGIGILSMFKAPDAEAALSLSQVAVTPKFMTAVALMLVISLCGGYFIVPLNALMQRRAKPEIMARVIAGNNIINSFFMAAGSLLMALATKCGLTSPGAFAVMGVLMMLTAILATRNLQHYQRYLNQRH